MERGPLQGRFGNAAPMGQHQISEHLLRDLLDSGGQKVLEHLPIEAGKCISHFIMNPWDVLS